MCSYPNKLICVPLEEIIGPFASGQNANSCHIPIHGQERHLAVHLPTRCLGGVTSSNVRCPSRTGHPDLSLPGLPFDPAGRNGHVQAVFNLAPIRLKVGCVTSWSPLFLSVASIITSRTINSNLDIWFGVLSVRNLAVPGRGDASSSGEVAQAWECVPVPGFAFCEMPSLCS